jgi:hypothetical protein
MRLQPTSFQVLGCDIKDRATIHHFNIGEAKHSLDAYESGIHIFGIFKILEFFYMLIN